MSQSVLEMATELTSALIQAGQLPPKAFQDILHKTYTSLRELKRKEANGATTPALGDWRKSITKNAITCLECGAAYKQLSIRHLRQHDLNGQSYRAKYRIPRTQPLTARSVTVLRRKLVQEIRPWTKTSRYIQEQAEKAKVAKRGRRKRVAGGKG